MMYWEQMKDKYGFSDGDAPPNGLDEYRRAYVLTVNTLAERLGSQTRAYAYNRAGMHNGCMILFVSAEDAKGYTPEQLAEGGYFPWNEESAPDRAFQNAVYAAFEMRVDDWVSVRASFSKTSQKSLLRACRKQEIPTCVK